MTDLLLLHGALGDRSQFDFLKPFLNINADAIDFSGHGQASVSANGFGIETFAKDVISHLDEKGIEKTNLFGFSMGGYVALWLLRNFPERVGNVMTLATKFNWNHKTAQAETKFLDAARIEEKVPAYAKKLADLHGADNWKTLLKNTAGMMMALADRALLDDLELGQLTGRVLIAVGDRDGMVSIEESVNAYRWIPEAQFLVLPGTVHPLEKADPELLSWHMNRFFAADKAKI